MNYLKFFRRRGFKKIRKPYLASDHINYGHSENEWRVYDGERNNYHNNYQRIIKLNSREAEEKSHLLIGEKHYTPMLYKMGEDEIYLFSSNRGTYILIMVNFNQQYYTRPVHFRLEDHGIENSFDENLQFVIGESRYRDYVITQLLKKDVKV